MSTTATPPQDRRPPSLNECLRVLPDALRSIKLALFAGVRTLRAALYAMTGQKEKLVADYTRDLGKDAGQRGIAAALWKDVTQQENAPAEQGAAQQKAAELKQKKWQQELSGWHLSS